MTIDSNATPHRWDYHYSDPVAPRSAIGDYAKYASAVMRSQRERAQAEIDREKIAGSAVIAAWDEDEK